MHSKGLQIISNPLKSNKFWTFLGNKLEFVRTLLISTIILMVSITYQSLVTSTTT